MNPRRRRHARARHKARARQHWLRTRKVYYYDADSITLIFRHPDGSVWDLQARQLRRR